MRTLLVALLVGLGAMGVACSRAPAAPPTTPTPAPRMETLLPPDAIRALDHPPTVGAAEASAHIAPQAQVIGLAVGDEARAYPLGLMNRHEVANDTLAGQPVAVTFCPLCNSGIAFSRAVGEGDAARALRFGVSGKVLDGALVMMDRETGSLWAQSRLVAVEGALAGQRLELLAASQMSWQDWAARYPHTSLVVDELAPPPTPFQLPALPVAGDTAPPTIAPGYVIGIVSPTVARAYPLSDVEAAVVINGEMAGLAPFALVALGEPGAVAAWERAHQGQPLTFAWQEATLRDQETGSVWDARRGVALSGPLAGAQLQPFPTTLSHWLGWQDLYPQSEVWQLSLD